MRKNLSDVIRARAPLRLGLGGGGTDVSPYCDLFGGCVLNATIDRYAYATIEPLADASLEFHAADLSRSEVAPLDSQPPDASALKLHWATYEFMMTTYNAGARIPLRLTTFCDAPAGSGLGSSSTVVVAAVMAFFDLLNVPLDQYLIARVAFHIEREICQLAGGRQDQYAAAFGGFNFMEFAAGNDVIVNTLRIRQNVICELEARIVLYYTGVSRESAEIISDQSANVKRGESEAVEAMHLMKQEAFAMKRALLTGDMAAFTDSMRSGWYSKKKIAQSVSNPKIEEAFSVALNAGAEAGKVSGAGGGGFVIFVAPPERRMQLIRALRDIGGTVSNCHFTEHGAQSWRV